MANTPKISPKPTVVDKELLHSQIHAGRRAKLRTRFLTDGLGTFTESEVLEFALGFVLPRVDTNLAAHSLLNRFGSLTAVMDAKPADLQEAYGIGEQAAIFLSFLQQCHTYLAKQSVKTVKLLSPGRARRYLQPLMKSYSVEQFVVVCLDKADNVKSVNGVTNNELDKVYLNIREIISLVTAQKAAKVIIAHNHLNECPEPSVSDMNTTRRLVRLFQLLGIELVDHLIFADDQAYSFADTGLLHVFKAEAAKHI